MPEAPSSESKLRDHQPLRVRAAAIIRRDGAVLLHRDRRDDFWALPGGAVDPGERTRDTICREIREELGWTIAVEGLAGVHEQSFHWRGRRHHELVLYFNARLAAAEYPAPSDGAEFPSREPHLLFRWVALAGLADLSLRPRAALDLVLNDGGQVLHMVD